MDVKPTKPRVWLRRSTAKSSRPRDLDHDRCHRAASFADRPALGSAARSHAPRAARFYDGFRALSQDPETRWRCSVHLRAHWLACLLFRALSRHPDHRGAARPGRRGLFRCWRETVGIARTPARRIYTGDMIRLRRFDNARQYRVRVMRFARSSCGCDNDGTSADQLMVGLFRIRCLTWLAAQIATIEPRSRLRQLRRRAGKGRRRNLSRARGQAVAGVGRAAGR